MVLFILARNLCNTFAIIQRGLEDHRIDFPCGASFRTAALKEALQCLHGLQRSRCAVSGLVAKALIGLLLFAFVSLAWTKAQKVCIRKCRAERVCSLCRSSYTAGKAPFPAPAAAAGLRTCDGKYQLHGESIKTDTRRRFWCASLCDRFTSTKPCALTCLETFAQCG